MNLEEQRQADKGGFPSHAKIYTAHPTSLQYPDQEYYDGLHMRLGWGWGGATISKTQEM